MRKANPTRRRAATRCRPLLPLALAVWGGAACADPSPPAGAERLAQLETPREHVRGRGLYENTCIACHGAYGLGTPNGPPLVHSVYRPSHHGDEAFQLAVAQGVRAHHWRFGDMPVVPGLTRADVTAIVGYIRWLQQEAGIE